MVKIETVHGSIEPDELGITLAHEHMLGDFTNWWNPPKEASKIPLIDAKITINNISELRRTPGSMKDNYIIVDVDLAIEELKPFKRLGGGSLVDLTLPGAGRDVLSLRRISEDTGVNIIAGTGWYVETTHPPIVRQKSVEELAEVMKQEITEGIEDTGIKAGIIGEIGCSYPLCSNEKKVLQAAARTQKETGASISIHNPAKDWREGQTYLDIIEKEGGTLERVTMLHMDHYNRDEMPLLGLKVDYHKEILNRGVTIAYDAFGRYQKFRKDGVSSPTDRERIAAIVELCKHGYDKQIVISQDVYLKLHLTRYGGQGYAYILRYIVPALKYAGVTDEQIRNMLVENPKRLLSF